MAAVTHDNLYKVRHSAAHLLAHALIQLYPGLKLTIGPVTKHGFFYDFLPTEHLSEIDLAKIDTRMRELAKKNYPITGCQVPKAEARTIFSDNKFKLELIDGIPGETVGVYTQGDFADLCAGGHTESTGDVKHFMLTGLAGSYWRADRTGTQLQRIMGIAFETKQDMDAYLQKLEDAKTYDHRNLGKQLDLFSFHPEAPGSVFFHNKGTFLFNKLVNLVRDAQKHLFQEVRTPMIMHTDLWKTSGHYDNFKDNMYFTHIDEHDHAIKPMNCPGGVLMYKEKPHSYRELPIRLAEFGLVYRHELSGVLHGLSRVRCFTQDDAHTFCMPEQAEDEVMAQVEMVLAVYKKFEFADIKFAVSTRPAKSMGAQSQWDTATDALKNALNRLNIPFIVQEGEGAFYGPKIEIAIEDAMERSWQCGTIQFDFNLPERFDLEYIQSDQTKARPVMLHRAILGSVERFLSVMLEHYKGRLPLWLAPVQARILPISEKQVDYAKVVCQKLAAAGIRVEIDHSNDKISAQIRRAQLDQIPWMLVVGDKEMDQNTVTLRHRDGTQEFGKTVEFLIEIANK